MVFSSVGTEAYVQAQEGEEIWFLDEKVVSATMMKMNSSQTAKQSLKTQCGTSQPHKILNYTYSNLY